MASVIRYLCCLLVFLPCVAIAQTNGTIPVGATLTATINTSSQWLSPSGDFAFGFQQLGNEDLFLLAIWYAKIPDKTIVWYAKDVSPVPSGSNISLTAGDGLILRNATGGQVWKSEFTLASVAYAVMNNTGNLMLKNSDSLVLWESFKLPTDTILPTQTLELGSVLSSRRSETNFSTGRFQLHLQLDGNLVLNLINLPSTHANVPPYYESGTNNTGQLVFNERGSLFILNSKNQTTFLSKEDAVGPESDYYYKATLNIDGVFTIDRHLKNSSGGSWNSYWLKPDDICFIPLGYSSSGVCGHNSLCRLNIDKRPTCECPVGYSLLDPNDAYGGCKIDYELFSCSEENSLKKGAENLYRIEEETNIDWPTGDYTHLQPYTEDQCRQSCMQDCFCSVAIFRSSRETCWMKKLPLSNGRRPVGTKAFIKLRRGNTTFTPEPRLKDKDNQDGLVFVGSILLSALGFFNFILLSVVGYISYLFYHKKLQKAPQSD